MGVFLWHCDNLLSLSECCYLSISSICLHTTVGCRWYASMCVCMHASLCAMELTTSSSGGNVSVPLTPVFPIWLVHTLSQQWQLFNQGTITHDRHTNIPAHVHTQKKKKKKKRRKRNKKKQQQLQHTLQTHTKNVHTERENGFYHSRKLCIL